MIIKQIELLPVSKKTKDNFMKAIMDSTPEELIEIAKMFRNCKKIKFGLSHIDI